MQLRTLQGEGTRKEIRENIRFEILTPLRPRRPTFEENKVKEGEK
jgi:hypothetical protein